MEMASEEKARRSGVEFHIASDDYFGTLATVLDLLRQDMSKSGRKEKHKTLLGMLVGELLYLQDRYKIIKMEKGREKTPCLAFIPGVPPAVPFPCYRTVLACPKLEDNYLLSCRTVSLQTTSAPTADEPDSRSASWPSFWA